MSGTKGEAPEAAGQQAFADAARLMWQSWADMATAGMRGMAGGAESPASNGQSALEALSRQWRALSEQTLSAWGAGGDPLLRQVAAQMARSQSGLLRLTEQLSAAWQAVAAQAGAGQDPAAMAARWAEQLQRLASPQELSAAGEDLATLWQTWLAMLQDSTGPWVKAWRQAPDHLGGALTGDRSELSDLSRLAWDAWEHSGGRLLQSPSLGFGREGQERLLLGFDAWMDYRRAVAEYQGVLAELSAEAMGAVARQLAARGQDGKPVRSLRELSALWTQAADEVFEAGFRSDRYAASQGAMVQKAMRYRQAERAIVEAALRNTDIATRSEIDEAFKEIHRLRRELRALRRELGAARATAQETKGGKRPTPKEQPV
jgi:class III poly(R)-hydroxyalkanoic acid synthase PhaE subunit